MSKLWLQIGQLLDEDERQMKAYCEAAAEDAAAAIERAREMNYRAFMRQHMPPTHEPIVGDEYEMWG